ncbi:MAG: MAPEG family protein [Myxococcota bacterium]
MTTALTCILIAGLLPYLGTLVAKRRMRLRHNRAPREYLETLEGAQKRAHWAQQNSFEALPLFAAAVLVAEFTEAPQLRADALAVTFVVARVGYIGAYIADRDRLRSILWFVGLLAVVGLFFI